MGLLSPEGIIEGEGVWRGWASVASIVERSPVRGQSSAGIAAGPLGRLFPSSALGVVQAVEGD